MLLDLEKIVRKYNLNIRGVIHIGAHLGQEYPIYKKLSIENIAFFEPQKEIFNQLKKTISTLEKIKFYNIALGNQTGTVKMYIDNYNQGSSSILQPKLHLTQHPHIKFESEENVNIEKLDNIIDSRDYNFINMDVQGFELEVLKGGKNCLKNIDYIMTEVNRDEVYKDCAKVEQVDQFLDNYGFIRVETSWEGIIWGDAFYIKKDSNNFLKSVALLTYSHSSYKDVLDIYFFQLTKYFPQIKGYLLIDKLDSVIPSNHEVVYYDDDFSYYKHCLNAITAIEEDYLIYMQDDYFFFSEPNLNVLNESLSRLKLDNLDFIRFNRTGDMDNLSNDLFHNIPQKSKYLFSTQATLWRKKSLFKLLTNAYEKYKYDNIWESEVRLNELAQNLDLKGAFLYNNGNKRGKNHWDSNDFPYIATAIIKGKWNFQEYKNELMEILISNKINTKRRINSRGFLNRLFTTAHYRLKLLMTSIIF